MTNYTIDDKKITSSGAQGVPGVANNSTVDINSAYVASPVAYSIRANAASNSFVVTLPTAIGIDGYRYTVTKIESSSNTVTVDGNLSETINGLSQTVLSKEFESLTVESNGVNWIIV